MARLVFDSSPLGPWRAETVEEHNASLLEFCAGYDWIEARPCDCGQYVEGMLCTCRPAERKHKTPARVAEIIQASRRREHLEGLAKKREFPRLGRCPLGVCYWCREPIVHGRVKQRSMHDGRKDEPNCRWEYALRTHRDTQLAYLLRRDGNGCTDCGSVKGRFGCYWNCTSEERALSWWKEAPSARRDFPEPPAGPFSWIRWDSALEVDHFVALAVAFEAFPDPARRRWFFGPRNLRLLCADCHKAKTRLDRALLREIYAGGEEFGRARVLDILAAAGLLKVASTKGPP